MPRPPSKTRAATPLRRASIIAVAVECFARDGFAGANIQEICERAGASVGTVYHHFGSKEGLLATAYLTVLNDYQRGSWPLLVPEWPAERVVKETVRYQMHWLVTHPSEARFLLQFLGADQHVELAPRELMEENETFLAKAADWLATAIETRQIRPLDFYVVAALMLGPVQQWVRLWLLKPNPTLPTEEIDQLAEGAWAALRAAD